MSPPDGRQSVSHREVEAEEAGQRLDNFLLARLKGVPRSHIYRLIRSGQVRVNAGRVSPRYRLAAGDRVRIPPVRQGRASVALKTPDGLDWLEARIVHEDDRLLVVDKPAGLAVHGGTGLELGLIEALRSLRPGLKTLELVHRLDRGTSGCVLVAKRRSTLRSLHALLRDGQIEKRYLALLAGNWQFGTRLVDAPLEVGRGVGEARVRVSEAGKPSRSEFRLVEHFGQLASLLEVGIETGRTHQIRVHAAYLDHPVAGDEKYGQRAFNERMRSFGLNRLFLHAHALQFTWPDSDEELAVSVPLPDELRAVLDALADRC